MLHRDLSTRTCRHAHISSSHVGRSARLAHHATVMHAIDAEGRHRVRLRADWSLQIMEFQDASADFHPGEGITSYEVEQRATNRMERVQTQNSHVRRS
jgi:hypothetical protein